VMGQTYPGPTIDDNLVFDAEALELLRNQCDGNELHFEMLRNLLDVERRYRTMSVRRGLFPELEHAVERCFYDSEEDALARARAIKAIHEPDLFEQEDAETIPIPATAVVSLTVNQATPRRKDAKI